MKKRQKGTGSVVRTPSGKFKATARLYDPIEKKSNRVSKTFETLKQANSFLEEMTGKSAVDYYPKNVSEYWERYLSLKKNSYRASTLAGATYFYEKHVKGSILDRVNFKELTPVIINRYFLGLASHGYATSTLTRWRKNFKSILTMATYEGFLDANPMESPQTMKTIKGRPSAPIYPFTKAEVKKLLEKKNLNRLPIVYRTFYMIALLTGARPQEILALTSADVTETSVRFNKSIGFKGKLQDCMKTPWSVRTVPIQAKFGAILQENIKTLPEKLFYSKKSKNGYLSKDNVGGKFRKYVSEVLYNGGEHNHRMYDTRHTYATLLITNEKIDVKTVSRLLGHSNIETTLKYYTHVGDLPRNTVLRL